MPQNKSKRRKDKTSSQRQHHELSSDSGSLNRKTKSPVRSHVPSESISENSVQSVRSSNELLGNKSEKSDVLNIHSSQCKQEDASGNSCCSSSNITSSLLQTLLDENIEMLKYNTQLNERTKCSSCGKSNFLIHSDLTDYSKCILTFLEENKKLKLENMSLKAENTNLMDQVNDLLHNFNVKSQQVDAGQDNLNSVVYSDSANHVDLNTEEMETEEGASAAAVIEPCSSQYHQEDNKTWDASKKENGWRSDIGKYETKSSASTENDSVSSLQEVGNDGTLRGNTADTSSWYEEDSTVASGGLDWSDNNGAGKGSQHDTERGISADEKHEGNPKEFKRSYHVQGGDQYEEKGGWRSSNFRNRSNRSSDLGDQRNYAAEGRRGNQWTGNNGAGEGSQHDARREATGGERRKGIPREFSRGRQGGDRSEDKSPWRNRGRPNRSADRGDQRDYAAEGRKGGGKNERRYKRVNEIFGDLFMAPSDHSLAHCVAEDMRMGSGIAVTFRQMFKNVETLLEQGKRSGQVAVLENDGRYIYYLVTKKVSNGKPRLSDLVSSVDEMKQHCIAYGVKKIAMPRIGCGLDRLEWSTVKDVLEDKFIDTDVCITVYNFQQGHGKHEKRFCSPDSVVSGKENHKKKKEKSKGKSKKNSKKNKR